MLSFSLEPSLPRNVGPEPAFFCVQRPLQACGRRVAVPAPWARGQPRFPLTVSTEPMERSGAATLRYAIPPPGRPSAGAPGKEHCGHEERLLYGDRPDCRRAGNPQRGGALLGRSCSEERLQEDGEH